MRKESMSTPSVSVCVCTYNGSEVVERAIDSVLGQSYDDFELVVLDDASADRTVDVVRGYSDPRIRLVANRFNLGNAQNRSKALRLARGSLVKFVDQDDWIASTCLARHVDLLDAAPRVGFSFSRRAIIAKDSAEAAEWSREYATGYRCFGDLAEVNSGTALLRRYVDAGFPGNWIGEPTSVMIRRECLGRSRLFNRELRQLLDMDLWIRLMAFFDVGFIDAELATRQIGSGGETQAIRSERRDWLDRLWMMEGLLEFADLRERFPELIVMRRSEQKSMLASLLTGRFRTRDPRAGLADAMHYTRYAGRRRVGSPASLFDGLE
jgi:glycosyltransferase involved in cell wall biosynthesis